MNKKIYNFIVFGALAATVAFTSCDKDDPAPNPNPNPEPATAQYLTIAGAMQGEKPGDGNAGTMVYAIELADAKDPSKTVNVYENGYAVKSNRTARLQASEDGNTLFNIAYTGDNGGEFSRYKVNGGKNFTQENGVVSVAQYAGTSPRWVKLFDGDKTGIAVNVTTPTANNAGKEGVAFEYYRGLATVLALDLQGVKINGFKQYELPLTKEEEAQGHCIFRLDAPVLNKAGNKLIIGTWMQKKNVKTGKNESDFERLGTKSVVVDYPSLENPKIITSTVATGDNSGYRSLFNFLAEDGSIYQATLRDPKGSHILKINQNNEYDNSYVFSLDAALGAKGVYVECWRYVGDDKAVALYRVDGSNESYVALLDLKAKTAKKLTDIAYDKTLSFQQYQGIRVIGDEVYIAVTPVGKDGNIYIVNSKTGAVTKGAKLENKDGNHYIGIF